MRQKEVELVVAHYNEALTWLDGVKAICTLYSKGTDISIPSNMRARSLPNIGREGHTYLHHIVTNYHDLAEVTLFVQGRIDDHVSQSIEELIDKASRLRGDDILTASSRELKLFDAWEGVHCDLHPNAVSSGRSVLRAPRRPGEYFAQFIGNCRLPLSVGFNPAAIFGVPRELIHRKSFKFYKELLEEMFLGQMAGNDPETGHMMEAFWLAMWKPEEYICWDPKDVSEVERNENGSLAKGRWSRDRHCIKALEI